MNVQPASTKLIHNQQSQKKCIVVADTLKGLFNFDIFHPIDKKQFVSWHLFLNKYSILDILETFFG